METSGIDQLRELLNQAMDSNKRAARTLGKAIEASSSLHRLPTPLETAESGDSAIPERRALARGIQAMATSPSAEAVLRALMDAAKGFWPESSGALSLRDEVGETMHLAAAWAGPTDWIRTDSPAPDRKSALGTALAAMAEDIEGEIQRLPLTGFGLSVGELRLRLHAVGGGQPDEGELALMELLAAGTGLALAGGVLQKRARHRSVRDPLTGLFNRRYMEDTMEREFHRCKRLGQSLGLITCDLDHFAQFNENWGFRAGDRLLQTVGGLIQASFRGSDVACRPDGQRFTVIMPAATLENTHLRAEQLRALIAELSLDDPGLAEARVTASFGVASFPLHAARVRDLIEAADSALFLAKQGQGNTVRDAEKVF